MQLSRAALAAAGFRATGVGQHYHVIHSLAHTIGADAAVIRQLDEFRKKRNMALYERAYAISETEADGMVQLARQLQTMILEWFRNSHPSLLRS